MSMLSIIQARTVLITNTIGVLFNTWFEVSCFPKK